MGENKTESPIARPESSEKSIAEKEMSGIWSAMQYVDKVASHRRFRLDQGFIREVHRRAMGHFPQTDPGRYRDFPVRISGTAKTPIDWREIGNAMTRFGSVLSSNTANINRSLENTEFVIKLAAWAHRELVDIHPFVDGNGRVARMLVDAIFKRAGFHYITDWDAYSGEYKRVVRQVDQTGRISIFEGFLAAKLASRYLDLKEQLKKRHNEKELVKSQSFADLLNRRNELLRIVKH